MKRYGFFAAALSGAVFFMGAQSTTNGQSSSEISKAADSKPERILEFLKDTNSLVKLDDREEQAHIERVRRLYELEKQRQADLQQTAANQSSVVQPTPGGDDIVPNPRLNTTVPTVPSVAANESDERMIEAVEQLQMEIRQLRTDLAGQSTNVNEAAGANLPQTEQSQTQQFQTEDFNPQLRSRWHNSQGIRINR